MTNEQQQNTFNENCVFARHNEQHDDIVHIYITSYHFDESFVIDDIVRACRTNEHVHQFVSVFVEMNEIESIVEMIDENEHIQHQYIQRIVDKKLQIAKINAFNCDVVHHMKNVMQIIAHIDTINNIIDECMNACESNEYFASCDDSYFDYAPSAMCIIKQLCVVMNARDKYNAFRQRIIDKFYFENIENIVDDIVTYD